MRLKRSQGARRQGAKGLPVGVSATGGIVALAASHRLMSMGLDSGSWQEHHGRERRGGEGREGRRLDHVERW